MLDGKSTHCLLKTNSIAAVVVVVVVVVVKIARSSIADSDTQIIPVPLYFLAGS
jgi:hypothetical protein